MNHISFIGTCNDVVPRTNFGPRWTASNAEDKFAIAFVESYSIKYPWLHSRSLKLNRIMAREVQVNGFGIADLVTVSWSMKTNAVSTELFPTKIRPTVRAFEFKLFDWRKGLMQAHRYRFFADAAILVLPNNKLPVVTLFHTTFRAINVGLWGFNPHNGAITMVITPKPRIPTDQIHREKAIARVLSLTKQAQLSP